MCRKSRTTGKLSWAAACWGGTDAKVKAEAFAFTYDAAAFPPSEVRLGP